MNGRSLNCFDGGLGMDYEDEDVEIDICQCKATLLHPWGMTVSKKIDITSLLLDTSCAKIVDNKSDNDT